MKIRLERPEDYSVLLKLTYEAFLTLNYPGKKRMDEHFLIHLLQGSPHVIPELCFIVEHDGLTIGHILYTKSQIIRPDGRVTDTITFGPLSIAPEYQHLGFGSALVHHSMDVASELGYGAVLITGIPDFYPKLGFRRAREYKLTLPDGTADDSFMSYELKPGYLSGGGIFQFIPSEFEQAENDDIGFQLFNKQFMADYYPGELTLRPLFDNDIALVENWIYKPHIAKWFKYPKHWLDEINKRHEEFSFLTHFIAEYEGIPIGFCQYYDTFFSKEHEVWNVSLDINEKQGKFFSIDYLIGEPEYLNHGFGKNMIEQMLNKLRKTDAKIVIVNPEPENIASNKVLKATGFKTNGSNYYLEL